jgi:hypothetical protein
MPDSYPQQPPYYEPRTPPCSGQVYPVHGRREVQQSQFRRLLCWHQSIPPSWVVIHPVSTASLLTTRGGDLAMSEFHILQIRYTSQYHRSYSPL